MDQRSTSLNEDEASETILEMVVGITVRYTIDSAIEDEAGSRAEPITININEIIKNENDGSVVERNFQLDTAEASQEGGKNTDFEVEMPSGETMHTRINVKTIGGTTAGQLPRIEYGTENKALPNGEQLALALEQPSLWDYILSWITSIRDRIWGMVSSIFGSS
ncbi:unnamed protein product [Echinostoma caproni]|uniref:Calx-beta domain-containing protein n=1 Tax=Echinostoma caproni TaxID=27848 RepID=A0A183AI36_9TREM|nr:unnamed protein product [Echinostoma caproni]